MRLGLPSKGRMAEDTQELLKVNVHRLTGCRNIKDRGFDIDCVMHQAADHACTGFCETRCCET